MHQLGSGLYVSGPLPPSPPPPPPPRERRRLSAGSSSPSSSLAPYTGGDGPLSGDLARMFPSPHSSPHLRPPPPPPAASSPRLPQSGLVVGPPRPSPPPSPEPSTRNPPAGPQKSEFASGIPIWCCFLAAAAVAAGIGIGVFVLVSARRLEVLAAASAVAAAVGVVGVWNWWSRAREAEGFFRRFPDSSVGRGSLPVGELVKISGDVSRCIFTSSELYEYRGWSGAPANPNHRRFTWGLRHSERNVANFYISDHGSGTRFLVRAGDGAKVTHFVKSKTIDINKGKRELTPNFINWLADNNLSIGDQLLRLKEGFIKEGDTASVIGILRRHHPYDIIDPPHGKVSTGCQWTRCLFPVLVEGLILIGDENPEDEVVYLA
ncbi:uncharacterized membrane protein At1g16860-like isoform X2 [Ananas comosus]|uniref:Uncharacterized membrane protein At1g16860-like isoform X2 n=1 Tax=Ananas comosus TaxID=4615 RepID=A0A6P5GV11_ANACO|nr:uncharacterized membrane protein At1g16860-like isoform X2 [Ananas comosus]